MMDAKLKDIEFLPDDFEFVGDKQDTFYGCCSSCKTCMARSY